MILREAEERMKLISDNTICTVFSAGINPRYLYPYGLQNAAHPSPSCRDMRYEVILDSACNSDEITNRRVIEIADDLNPDYIIPKDYPGKRHRTRESMREFIQLYQDNSSVHAKPMIVLQPDYVQEYREHKEFYEQFGAFGLGGLLAYDPETQIELIRRFREEVGEFTRLHAFGIGTNLKTIRALRQNPRLIDSLDTSTAETCISKNKIRDKSWQGTPFYIPEGLDSTSVRARFSAAMLYMMNYMLGTRVDDDDLEAEYKEQTTLGSFSKATEEVDIDFEENGRHAAWAELNKDMPAD